MIHSSDNAVVQYQLDLNPQRRRDFLAECNATLLKAREKLLHDNRRLGGLKACRKFSDFMDGLLKRIYDWLVEEARLGRPDYNRIALVAQGGYGRAELNPFSDIDLLFLMPETPRPVEQAFVKSFLYVLWDLNKIELGHATKRVSEAVASVGVDLDSTTALITTRLLAGSQPPLSELQRRLSAQLKGPSRKWFIDCKLAETQTRREKYGSTVYMLEPNVKDGEGGLRDVHSLQWLAYVLLGRADLDVLAERSVLHSSELGAIREALDFMLSVRTALHTTEGRKIDALTFDKQPTVAATLGYKSDPELLAEEKMMKNYYLHAHNIDRYAQKAIRILTVRARSAIGGMIEAMGRRRVNSHYFLKSGILHLKYHDAEFFRKDPVRVMEAFWLATQTGAVMAEELKELIAEARPATNNEEFRTSPRCRDLFMQIMAQKRHVEQTIHAMHDTGTLTDYMPEFGNLYCMARIDHYHKYTVDEHLIKTLGVSEELINGEGPAQRTELVEAARAIERWDLLNLSLLLHDIGKGQGHGHVIRGAILSQKMTQRMGLPPADQEVVRQLILQHLKMVHMSQRRDLDDPHVIREMTETVPDPELLRMLFVLTYCDTRAVGPSAWTDWKAILLIDLFNKTTLALAGKNPIRPFDESQKTKLRNRVLEAGADALTPGQVDQFLNNAPRKYLTTVPPPRMARHLQLLHQITPANQIVWEVYEPENYNYTEITAVSYDVRGLMSWLCAALSSKDINIMSMQAFSTKDGYAIDSFQVTDLRGNRLPAGFRLDRLRNDLNLVIQKKATAQELFPVRKRPVASRDDLHVIKPNQIIFNNEASPDYTVLEVKAVDRPGLLYDITSLCTNQGYFIHLAMITTEAYRVVDVFYITDLENNKLEPARIKKLEAALNEVVS